MAHADEEGCGQEQPTCMWMKLSTECDIDPEEKTEDKTEDFPHESNICYLPIAITCLNTSGPKMAP